MIDLALLEILACPSEHHAPLEPNAGEDLAAATALICVRCRSTFPIRDGIPIMLMSEATPGPLGFGADVSDDDERAAPTQRAEQDRASQQGEQS